MKKYIENFSAYAPEIKEHKDIIFLLALSVILILALIFASMKLTSNYIDRNEKLEKISQMESFIADWQKKSNILASEPMLPIKEEEVDEIQTNIIFNIQASNLALVSLKENEGSQKGGNNAREFEVTFNGDYQQVMQYLSDFYSNKALISITKLTLAHDKNKIKAVMSYKIYTK